MSQNWTDPSWEGYDRGVLEGLAKPITTNVFESQWTDALASSQYGISEDVKYLHISVDPSAGKDRNMYSLMNALYWAPNVAQIVVQHIKECRKLKHIVDAKPIVTLDCNLHVLSQQLMADIEFVPNRIKQSPDTNRIYFALSFVNSQFDDIKAEILTQLRNFRGQRHDDHFVAHLFNGCY